MPKMPPWNIEAAEDLMLKCAMLVDKIGPHAQPLLDRAEREYHALRKPKEVDRIKALIAAHHAEDGCDQPS